MTPLRPCSRQDNTVRRLRPCSRQGNTVRRLRPCSRHGNTVRRLASGLAARPTRLALGLGPWATRPKASLLGVVALWAVLLGPAQTEAAQHLLSRPRPHASSLAADSHSYSEHWRVPNSHSYSEHWRVLKSMSPSHSLSTAQASKELQAPAASYSAQVQATAASYSAQVQATAASYSARVLNSQSYRAQVQATTKASMSKRRSPPPRPRPPPPPRRPRVIRVGGRRGFDFNVANFWKAPVAYVGDRLWFPSPTAIPGQPNQHNVYRMPSKDAWERCDFRGATYLGGHNFTSRKFTHRGWYFYACGCCGGDYAHCIAQQKIAIRVLP